MIIKCKKNLLTSAINIVSKAVSTKTTMPILECILLKAEGGKVYLTANNLELGIETVIDATVLEEGQVALEAKIFSDIIRKLPEFGDPGIYFFSALQSQLVSPALFL